MGITTLPTIQGYLVHEEIEAGGFGVVYRATQPLLGRDVAIKFILPHYANEPEFVRNFEAEAQRIARLEHPHIVPVYDYWRDPHGAYLVMRWLPRTLKARLQEGVLTLTETLHLLDQIADALAATHRQGVIHRDIKPGNILVDDQNNYYLTDFGIAKDLLSRVMTGSHIMKGTVAYIAPEQARGEVVSPQTDIYSLGVMLYEVLTGQHPLEGLSSAEMIVKHLNEPLPDLPAPLQLPMELNAVLQKATAKQSINRYHDTLQFAHAFRACVMPSIELPQAGGRAAIITEQPTTIGQRILRNPYKGLHAFELMDAGDFYGREALVQQLLTRLQEDHPYQHFLAVVGASGSGKSSVVKAGLLPALRAGCLPGSRDWFTVEMNPGEHPLQELTNALNRVATKPISHISEQLRADRRGLIWAVASLLSEDARLVLVVDQFEELFTTSVDLDEVEQFLEVLRVAVSDATSGVRIIITLRADFMDRPLQYLEFGDLLKQRIEYVLPLSPSELAEAITRPAEQAGLQVEASLVTAIVADVQDEPGALPLLQYTLTELFDRHDNHTLTLAAYKQLGGLSGALLQRADQIFEQFPSPQQDIIRQMFMRLVTLGEGVEDTRRRVRQTELLALVDTPDVLLDVLGRFGQARLLTFDRDPITREPTVEVAHEALIREWRRLRTWLDESRYDIRQQRLLAAAAHEWANAKRDKSYLLTGSRLAQFEGWVNQTTVTLTPPERAFVDTSITENLRQQTQRRRIRNMAFVTTGAVALILAILSIVAFQQRTAARHERDNAERALVKSEREAAVNNSLVLAYSALDRGETEIGLLLALEAVKIDDPPAESIRALTSLAFGDGPRAFLRDHGNAIRTVAFSPSAQFAVSGGCAELVENRCVKGELILWNMSSFQEEFHFEGHTDWVNSATFSPDGLTLLSASSDSTLILWDVETSAIIRRFEGHIGGVNGVVFAVDGQTAFSGGNDGTLIQWDVSTGEVIRRLEGHTGAVTAIALSLDGKTLASGSEDTSVILWDTETGSMLHTLTGVANANITAIAFNPAEDAITVTGADASLADWNVETGEFIYRGTTGGHGVAVNFTPDGEGAYIANGVCLWFRTPKEVVEGRGSCDYGGQISTSAISQDGQLVIAGYRDGTLLLLGTAETPEIRRFEANMPWMTTAVSPDGKYLLTGSFGDGVAVLWDLQTGREIRRFEGQTGLNVAAMDINGDGLALLGSGNYYGETTDRKLVLVDLETGEEIREFQGFQYFPRSVAFSPDGKQAVCGFLQWGGGWAEINGGELIVYEVESGDIVHQFSVEGWITAVDFSPSGKYIIGTGHSKNYIVIWDIETGKLFRRIDFDPATGQSPFQAIWGPDDTSFLVSFSNGMTGLYDTQTGKPIRYFWSDIIWGLALSPDNRYLVAGDAGGTITIWDFATGEEIRHFIGEGVTTAAYNVMFAPDGQTVFSAHINGPVIQWQIADWPIDELLTWVHENRYIREFTCEERVRYRIEPLCEQ